MRMELREISAELGLSVVGECGRQISGITFAARATETELAIAANVKQAAETKAGRY